MELNRKATLNYTKTKRAAFIAVFFLIKGIKQEGSV
jgi:hypothetical protein